MRQFQVLILIALMACSSTTLFAQRDVNLNKPKIEQLKIGFLTERMNLSTEEAQKFWPLYNEYNKELQLVKGQSQLKKQEIRLYMGSVSDGDLEKLSDELIGLKIKQLELFQNYYPKFKSILPIEKVLLFYRAEEEFPKWVFKQVRQNQRENQMNRNRVPRN